MQAFKSKNAKTKHPEVLRSWHYLYYPFKKDKSLSA